MIQCKTWDVPHMSITCQSDWAINLIDKLNTSIFQSKLNSGKGKILIFIFHSVGKKPKKFCFMKIPCFTQIFVNIAYSQSTMYTYTIRCSLGSPQDNVAMWTCTKSLSNQSKTRICDFSLVKRNTFINWSLLNRKLMYSSQKKIFIC